MQFVVQTFVIDTYVNIKRDILLLVQISLIGKNPHYSFSKSKVKVNRLFFPGSIRTSLENLIFPESIHFPFRSRTSSIYAPFVIRTANS